jgi:hypothetical protein
MSGLSKEEVQEIIDDSEDDHYNYFDDFYKHPEDEDSDLIDKDLSFFEKILDKVKSYTKNYIYDCLENEIDDDNTESIVDSVEFYSNLNIEQNSTLGVSKLSKFAEERLKKQARLVEPNLYLNSLESTSPNSFPDETDGMFSQHANNKNNHFAESLPIRKVIQYFIFNHPYYRFFFFVILSIFFRNSFMISFFLFVFLCFYSCFYPFFHRKIWIICIAVFYISIIALMIIFLVYTYSYGGGIFSFGSIFAAFIPFFFVFLFILIESFVVEKSGLMFCNLRLVHSIIYEEEENEEKKQNMIKKMKEKVERRKKRERKLLRQKQKENEKNMELELLAIRKPVKSFSSLRNHVDSMEEPQVEDDNTHSFQNPIVVCSPFVVSDQNNMNSSSSQNHNFSSPNTTAKLPDYLVFVSRSSGLNFLKSVFSNFKNGESYHLEKLIVDALFLILFYVSFNTSFIFKVNYCSYFLSKCFCTCHNGRYK